MSTGATIAFGITGSIASYKAPLVVRALLDAGVRVLPVMTRASTQFLGPSTMSGLTGSRVYGDMWDPLYPGEMHVELARSIDLLAVVPATADVLSRFAQGRVRDTLTALYSCFSGPVVLAPAMHPRMWGSAGNQRALETLRADPRHSFVGPVDGKVASGEVGMGRLADPEEIARFILSHLRPKDLAGQRWLVTAGPTVEDLDPVRFLGNRSTGAMGFAIAEAAATRGADVTLVAGPVTLPTPAGVTRVDVRSALSMREAVHGGWARMDTVVMCAAVADYRPKEVSQEKTKKQGEALTLELVRNPDILAELGAERKAKGKGPKLVGFAVETGGPDQILAYARGKLEKKQIDLIVANAAEDSFGKRSNRVAFVTNGADETPPFLSGSKLELSHALIDRIRSL